MKEKNEKKLHPNTAPEVVYTQADPLDRKKLILRLLTVCAVVLALFVGFSIFFRVEKVEVIGAQQYTEDTILEVSGIEKGASLLTFGKGKACARIKEALPYVETIRIGIKLPGTVRITIEEVDVVYSIQDNTDQWWFMTSEGRLIEQVSASKAANETVVKGFRIQDAKAGEQAVAMEPEQEEPEVLEEGEEQEPVIAVTNAERLVTALEILRELENNEILGDVSEVDVTDMGDIFLWFGTKTKILLGDPGQIDTKIATMKAIVEDDKIDASGEVDLTQPDVDDGISITPFE